MQCVTECSRLKSTGVDSDVINAHDKDYTAGCDKGENKFLKFCFWHKKTSLNNNESVLFVITQRVCVSNINQIFKLSVILLNNVN